MCVLASCRERAAAAADTARQAPPPVVARDTVKPIAAPADTVADTVPHMHEPEVSSVPTDSFLPKWTYDSVPGWLVINSLSTYPTEARFLRNAARLQPDSVVAIIPFDSSWARADRRRSLTLLLPEGGETVFPNGFVRRLDEYSEDNATVVTLRSSRRFSLSGLFAAWLLPTEYAKDAAALPIHDEVSADSTRRTWSIGPVRFVLRRTSPIQATLTAERDGVQPEEMNTIGVDTANDNHMGVESPKTLSLVDEWRVPKIGSAFRLGKNGPIVVVYERSGYECANLFAVVFFEHRIAFMDGPEFYLCAR